MRQRPRYPLPMSTPSIQARWLGRQPYEPIWRAMQAYTDTRDNATMDEIWLMDHEPVFTLGQAGKLEHVLAPGDIPVIPVDRGGQVTYHGPGQLVAYPLLDLRRLGLGVRELVQQLEQVGIDLLAEFGIDAERRAGAPGLYVAGRKILAIGIRVRRGCTFHGIALNAALDLEPFGRINPCGYRGLEVTQIADFQPAPALPELALRYLHCFCASFGLAALPQIATDLPQPTPA
jgi:lipoyl(octanoyl) transferase